MPPYLVMSFVAKLLTKFREGKSEKDVVTIIIQYPKIVSLAQILDNYRVVSAIALLAKLQGQFITDVLFNSFGLKFFHQIWVGKRIVRS